jgi:plastocyanin
MYSDTKLAVLLGVVVVASALAVGPAAAAGPAGTTDAGAAAERTSTPGESVTVFQTNGSAGGTTEVVLEPDSETVEPGDTVTSRRSTPRVPR